MEISVQTLSPGSPPFFDGATLALIISEQIIGETHDEGTRGHSFDHSRRSSSLLA